MLSDNKLVFIITLYLVTIHANAKNTGGGPQNYSEFLNFGYKKFHKIDSINLENEVNKIKIDVLGDILKKYLDSIKSVSKLDVVFLIDSSSSVGANNFKSELKFVKKLLSDIIVDYDHTRVAVVAFSSQNNILKNIDEIGKSSKSYNKCILLTKQLKSIKYKGGETFTLGALKKAQEIFETSNRNDSKKIIFLITDGYSNGGDPVPVAKDLKKNSVTIVTIGIQNGNYKELYEISSTPGEYFSFLLDSFTEFESLARRALHSDLKNGDYVPLDYPEFCNGLCPEGNCCDVNAICSCGTTTGHYSCVCKRGYYGTGLKNNCVPCSPGTYSDGPNICLPCPDPFHTTEIPAYGINSCKCKEGYKPSANNRECKELKCHKISAPKNGYYVKNKLCPNVIFSACGIRCEVGYSLKGTSVRLCQKNGTWSGLEPVCEVKTCEQLETPKDGKMKCIRIYTKEKIVNNATFLPVDTLCKFSCNEGYLISGSKDRICLPISRWSGLKALCKPIRCKKLPSINFGTITPSSCKSGKQAYGKVCKFTCDDGFTLQGSSEMKCIGNNGVWDNKIGTSVCIDNTPPSISCPGNLVGEAQSNKKYGHVTWTAPVATDNSKLNISVWAKPTIVNIDTFKFEIGVTHVQYFAQDAFQNRNSCSFQVTIKDNEAPRFENCIDPPTFLTNDRNGANITWDEPVAIDNSQQVEVTKSREFGFFEVGRSVVKYTAVDSFNNTNTCILNITVEVSKCEPLPSLVNGQSSCINQTDGISCLVTCDEGYSIPISHQDNDKVFECDNNYPEWYGIDGYTPPECSVTQVPDQILTGNIEVPMSNSCSDQYGVETIKNETTNFVNSNLCDDNNCTLNIDFECQNEGDKSMKEYDKNIMKREVEQENRINKHRRVVKAKFRLRQKYNPKNKTITNHQIKLGNGRKGFLQYKTKIVCPPGFIQRIKRCVHCPRGTFHNDTRDICQSCPFGQYNDKVGQTACIQCPLHYSTGKLRSKKFEECREKCPPGTHARKKYQKIKRKGKVTYIEKLSLKPQCSACGIGYYQHNFGELTCIPCPEGYTTSTIGASSLNQCIPTSQELCKNNNACINGVCSLVNNYEYTCNCFDNYIGAYCEENINLCSSQPCYNEGICSYEGNKYNCSCKEGYSGFFCQDTTDIPPKKCLNNGISYLEDNNLTTCICPSGYTGDMCEIKINPCKDTICENNSTCIEKGERFYCKCSSGFMGVRCHLLPCDYNPCIDAKICVNILEDNATIDSYSCICPEGYTGENCENKINYCSNLPCLNGGTCNNGLNNYNCTCSAVFTGVNCENKRDTEYILSFNSYFTNNFVKLKPFIENLTEISTCFWIQTLDDVNYGTIISYATTLYDNAFTLTDYTGLVIYINNKYIVTDIHLNDGLWHHLCVTWSSLKGAYKIFLDGNLVKFGLNLSPGNVIEGKGSVILGQEQDSLGGKFSQSESFVGKLTYVDIWSKVLTHEDISKHFTDCNTTFCGNLYAWPEMQDYIYGSVKIEKSYFCKNCETPRTLFNGIINVSNNVAYYSCYPGFSLSNSNFENGRKCTKASYWEGYYEPYCKRKFCGYPGSINNGYTIGRNYFFGDKIIYHCYEGYHLSGNRTIECMQTGKWFPNKPRCISTHLCAAFHKPKNAEIVVLSDQNYEDYKDIETEFEVGTQIEIRCFEKYQIVGETVLSCLDSGFWDFQPPHCFPIVTSIPEPRTRLTLKTTVKLTPKTTPKPSTKLTPQTIPIPKPSMKLTPQTITTPKPSTKLTPQTIITPKPSTKLTPQTITTPNPSTKLTPQTITTQTTTPKPQKYGCSLDLLPKAPPNGYVDLESYYQASNGTKNFVEYKCYKGYKLLGENSTSCIIDGYWSEPNISCEAITCGAWPKFKNMLSIKGQSSNNTYYVNNTITFKCDEGHEKLGTVLVIRCLESGKWSRIQGKCLRRSCGKPEIADDTDIEGKSYLFGDIVKITCKNSITYVLTCNKDGLWIGDKDKSC